MFLEYQSDPVTLSAPLFSWLLVVLDTYFSHHTSAALPAACLLRLLLSGLMEDGVWLHFPRFGSPVPISCIHAAITSWRFLSSLLLANYHKPFLYLPSASQELSTLPPCCGSILPRCDQLCAHLRFIGKRRAGGEKTASRDRLPCAVLCLSLSSVRLFATLWTVACKAPLSMGFSRQEYWSGLPCPPPGHLSNPGIKPRSPTLQVDSLLSELKLFFSWFPMTICLSHASLVAQRDCHRKL